MGIITVFSVSLEFRSLIDRRRGGSPGPATGVCMCNGLFFSLMENTEKLMTRYYVGQRTLGLQVEILC